MWNFFDKYGQLRQVGYAGPATPGWQLICDQLLGVSQASFDTNTILSGNIPQTYKHLKIIMHVRIDVAGPGLAIRFNNDATGVYNFSYTDVTAAGSTTSSSGGAAQVRAVCGLTSGSTDGANRFTPTEILIPDYTNTTNVKTGVFNSGGWQQATYRSEVGSFEYDVVGALTRITMSGWAGTGNFVAGSRFSLYGIT